MTARSTNATAEAMRDSLFHSDRLRQIAADGAGLYVQSAIATTRWRIEADSLLHALRARPPCIVAFWHECLPSMPALWRFAARDPALPIGHVLASRHRDGQLIGRAMRRFGIETVPGSTSRGGASGLRQLLKLLATGHPIGLTPDGPRGPRHRAAPGVAQLAARAGVPIFCAAAITRAAITTGGWDRMRIPLPFSRGALVALPPLTIGRDDWQTALPLIENGLNTALERAWALCR
ncbi:hypothetical protein ACOSOMT5_P2645 [Acidiphilium sp. MT5]